MDTGPDARGFEQCVRALHDDFGAALGARDPRAAAACYAPDARLVAPSADVVEGRAAIAAFWRAGLDAGIRVVDRIPTRIDGRGSIAFEIGQYALRLRPPSGGWVVDRGTYLVVHERGPDGRWAWALEMFTPDGLPRVASASGRDGRDDGTEVGDRR